MARTDRPFEIVIPIYPRVTHLDFTAPHQVLGRTPNSRITVASLGARDVAAEGFVFSGLTDLASIERCDLLCVPGGVGTIEAMLDDAFIREIRRLGAGARYLTSVCTGSLILGAAGFLAGKRAACHWAWRGLLAPFGAIVDDRRVVQDGRIITGGGVTAGIDFAFAVLAEVAGAEYAQTVQLALEYDPQPPFSAGRPETAPPNVLAAYQRQVAPLGPGRQAAAEEAARRLLVA